MMMQRGAVGSAVLTAVALTAIVGVAAAVPAPDKAAASVSHGKVTDNLYMSLGAFEDATSGEDPRVKAMIDRTDIGGVQVAAPWKAL
ncbi:hypothetical protein [Streptomyces sp. NPDC048272]|uniref:hypothetical protein n=1 Tax=Streptomyces sp. NPDC048272 TaxID=3154616 RepID=UPI003424348F